LLKVQTGRLANFATFDMLAVDSLMGFQQQWQPAAMQQRMLTLAQRNYEHKPVSLWHCIIML
jgi:hypothetical protein